MSLDEQFPTFRAAGRLAARASKKALRVFRWLGIGLTVLLVAFLIVHLILTVVWGRSLERKLAELRAAGEPASPADFVPKPIPDSENAAAVYKRAFEAMTVSPYPTKRIGRVSEEALCDFFHPDVGFEGRTKLLPQVRKIVAENAAVFVLVGEASRRPKCQFPVHWEQGFEVSFDHLAPLRNCARLVAARAIIRARDGQIDAALAAIQFT